MFATSRARPDQVKTYSLQSTLPRLPVPDLEKSLEAYLKSLIPVMEQKYGSAALKKEVEKRRLFIRDFTSQGGLGRVLQQRLLDLDHVSPNNWLNDTLWLTLAYHTWRAPLLINSNWWLLFAPDPSDPPPPAYVPDNATEGSTQGSMAQPDPDPEAIVVEGSQRGGKTWVKEHEKVERGVEYEVALKREWVTDWQVRKASWMVRRFAEFRARLAKEEIAPDSSKAGPFCMEQYRHIFNFSRIPLPGCDAFSAPVPQALHLTLMIDDFIYAIDVFAPPSSPTGVPEPLSVAEIERNMKAAVTDARGRIEKGEKAAAVGVLTADERDAWTKNREQLIALSPSNRTTLNNISSSLMALTLDTYTLPSLPPPAGEDLLRLAPVDAQIRNCAAGVNGGANRWFDKAVSVAVETNGRAGIMGEHSPVDALIPSIAIEYVLAEPVDTSAFTSKGAGGAQGGKFERLDWVTDEALLAEIELCRERNKALIADSDASQLWWGEYGVDWIKKTAKISPDAYIQQALQLAWYRDQGYATATYETASTRGMLHGRTDVIRSLSQESRDFVKSMMDEKADATTRYALLDKAARAHTQLTKTSSAGHGFDRHLMGLKTRLRSGETHALFEDEMYAKSQEWKLSTSGLSAGGKFMGTGFGAAWPDGYGINYLTGPFLLKFGIESKFSSASTSTAKFKHQIVQALRDMRAVCEEAAPQAATEQVPKAKL